MRAGAGNYYNDGGVAGLDKLRRVLSGLADTINLKINKKT